MLGPNTDVVNGQMVALQNRDAYYPIAFGPVPGQASQPAPVPTIPPAYSSFAGVYSSGGSPAAGGGTGVTQAAAVSAPFNFKLSPLPWAIIFLVGGLLGLRYIHWR